MNPVLDEVLPINGGAVSLLGLLSLPGAEAPRIEQAIVVVVGGPQYRVGSHRQFVLMARRLAAQGVAVLRFDVSGMGDSPGPATDFEKQTPCIRAAIDALHNRLPGLKRLTLWGLCDGASAALLYLDESADPRVSGLCLVNPWVRSETSQARTQLKFYYLGRLRQPDFWRKLFRGGVGSMALLDLARNLGRAWDRPRTKHSTGPFQSRMAQAWRQFPGRILLVLSGQDLVAKEFVEYARSNAEWSGALELDKVLVNELPEADHTFSNADARAWLEQQTLAWQLRNE
ncbi:MAG TPA: hydrolase 1, exosortase A system-associated [Burkholderiaceae bacterium]|jgi:exosortase A-associated hydrolase 1